MPSVPRFTISQNDEFVLVTIKVPFIRVTSSEVITDGHDFSFYCAPYLLKLTFPGEFAEEDERCRAVYDPMNDNGTLVAHLPKKTLGEHFIDLDLTTKLLQIRRNKDVEEAKLEGSIEVLDSIEFDNDNGDETDVPTGAPDARGLLIGKPIKSYGFNQSYSKVLSNLRDELVDMLEIKDPETIPVDHRRSLRLQSENIRFDIERYLGDYFDGESDPLYGEAMSYKPFWVKQWDISKDLDKEAKQQKIEGSTVKGNNKDKAFEAVGGFTENEREIMSNSLKHKEYLIVSGSAEERSLFNVLVDILFAYCYDVRMTQGEDTNVESASNVARLSAALSWLDPMNSPLDTVSAIIKCNLRRSIILPYLRVWKLSRKVLTDVTKILFLGKRTILKCLLAVRTFFEHTDTHYLLNKLYLDDFCVWIQSDSVSEDAITAFAKEYNNAKTAIETSPHQGKEYMGLYLPELEAWATKQQQGEEADEEEEEEEESDDEDSEESESEEESEAESEEDSDDEPSTQKDVDKPAVETSEGDGSLLYSIPKKWLVYDGQHLLGPELAYLDYTTISNDTAAPIVDEKTESISKLLLTTDDKPQSKVLDSLLGTSKEAVSETTPPLVKRVLIEEISSFSVEESLQVEGTSSDVHNIDSELAQLSVSSESDN